MKLHYHPLSPYSRKALVAVLHRADPVELQEIPLGQGILKSDAFRQISPFGKMPALETPAGPLCESTSIIEFLEERGPPVLLPPETARVARHFDRLGDQYLMAPMADLFWQEDSEFAKRAPEWIAAAWQLFERQLGSQRFVCGDSLTLGDLSGAIATDYLQRMGWDPPAAIDAWRRRCMDVPAMAQSLQWALPYVERFLGERGRALA